MRDVRIRAARAGRSQSEVLEAAVREGLGVIGRIRAKARLSEEEALELAADAPSSRTTLVARHAA